MRLYTNEPSKLQQPPITNTAESTMKTANELDTGKKRGGAAVYITKTGLNENLLPGTMLDNN